MEKHPQIVSPNNLQTLIESQTPQNSLAVRIELYFNFEMTTSERSQKERRRDLKLWSPGLSASFLEYLKAYLDKKGRRRWSGSAINGYWLA